MSLRGLLLGFLVLSGRAAYADTPITFNNQVVRIFQQHCQTCHRPGNIAPFSLLTYQDARPWARSVREQVLLKTMPPWKPVNSHGVFSGERSLTDQEIQTISQWVDNGAEEGAPADLPDPIRFPETWSAGSPDIALQPSSAYTVPQGDDIYRCFPMPVNSDSDVYVRGYEIIPGNRAIVHHVILFIDQFNESAKLEGADSGPGYTCFGGAGFTNGLNAVGAWAPGASAQMFPLGSGIRIPKGARVVMQVHYSLLGFSRTSSGLPDPDLTRTGLYTSTVPLEEISFLPIVNPFFLLPAGQSSVQVKASLPISRTVELVAIAPHMHLLGRQATVDAVLPDKTRRSLIRIDDWNFQWQGNYDYKDPIILPAGTIVEMTAVYDNSLNNPRNPSNPPVAVRWGERTVDEMCLTFISVKSPTTPSVNTLQFSMTDRSTNSILTQGSSANTQVGYARISESSGNAPAGLAIFSYRQNNVLISEATVAASSAISQGRMYAETSANVRSGVAIANPNSDESVVSFSFVDENGRTAYSGSAKIPGNNQVAGLLNDSPFNGPGGFSGSFTFNASKPVAVVALREFVNERGDPIWSALPVVDLASPPGAASSAFADFADGGGWASQIMLVNPTDAAISGSLKFASPSGQQLSVMNYAIPARGAQKLVTAGSGDSVRTGTVTIVPSGNTAMPGGSLVFAHTTSNVRVAESAVSASAAANAFRVYVEATDTTQSGIAILNPSANSATVKMDLMDLSGASLAGTTMSLGPNAQYAGFLTEIPGLQSLSLPVQGLLRITSASPIAAIGLRARSNERGDLLFTTTPPVAETNSSSSELFFPHFADAGGYTTQFILFSSGGTRALGGTIRFFSQSGAPLSLPVR